MESDPRERFVDQLKQLRTLAGKPSLTALEKQNPALLKQQTVSDLLAGRGVRPPRWELIAAFVTACAQTGKTAKLTMPSEDMLIAEWRHRHAALVAALDQPLPHGRRARTNDNSDNCAAVPAPGSGTGRRRFGAVPPRAGAFQHRTVAQVLIDAAADGGTTVLTGAGTTPASVLTGLGGVGKTQLAADHAHTQWDSGRVEVLVWISARTRDAITSAYAEAAVDLLNQDPIVPERAARRLLEWLSETNVPWLIVLDDLQAPVDLSGLWPPHSPNGQVVLTTRCRDAALHSDQRRIVDVDLFTPEEALAYLTEKLPARTRTDTATANLAGLAHDLGYLPLALAQAAAYMTNKPLLTTTDYRSKLADRRIKLRDVLPQERDLPDEHKQTVAATWSLSIEAADQLDPTGLAQPVLELASLLDPAGIPATIFTTDATTNYLSACLDRNVTGEDVLGGLQCLRRFSLLTLDPDQPHHAARVHALVQRAVRDTLTTGTLADITWAAADAVLQAWPDSETDHELVHALRSNTSALQHVADEHLWQPHCHPVLVRHTDSLGEAGLLDSAITATERLLHHASPHLGPDHSDTLIIRHSLANWRGHAGDAAGAVVAFEELLADQLRIVGPDHRHTLTIRGNIALWRGWSGDPAGAVTALEELLTHQLRILGPDDSGTLITRSNIAEYRGHAGDAAGAVVAFEELLTDQLRVLGPDHPHALSTRLNIATCRGEAGDPVGAVAALDKLLVDYLRTAGPDHPYTLKTRAKIALWRGIAGDPAGAVTAFEELLANQLRILGPDHPDTLATRGNIALFRMRAGDPAGALVAFEELLAGQLQILAPDHPETLTTRGHIAKCRGFTGNPAGAVTAFEELLTDQLRVLGPDHPHVLGTRGNIAQFCGVAGDSAGAVTALEELLTDQLRVLGPDHPDTVATRSNIAHWRQVSGEE